MVEVHVCLQLALLIPCLRSARMRLSCIPFLARIDLIPPNIERIIVNPSSQGTGRFVNPFTPDCTDELYPNGLRREMVAAATRMAKRTSSFKMFRIHRQADMPGYDIVMDGCMERTKSIIPMVEDINPISLISEDWDWSDDGCSLSDNQEIMRIWASCPRILISILTGRMLVRLLRSLRR